MSNIGKPFVPMLAAKLDGIHTMRVQSNTEERTTSTSNSNTMKVRARVTTINTATMAASQAQAIEVVQFLHLQRRGHHRAQRTMQKVR